ncbi:MAG: protein translocase subunit SecD [Phycisphaerales bacterium]|nr:MAG: protein translocase subunit SecD [Phycisphaerales bacterium]
MRHFRSWLMVAVTVLVVCAWSIVPPERQLRLGKDLAGGVSLVYSVQIEPGEDPQRVLSDTIEVLKRRVDPQGQFDILMVAQGRDRIEITMPLPSERVKRLRADFEAQLARLRTDGLDAGAFERLMRQEPEAREREIEQMRGSNPERARLAEAAASAFDTAAEARAAYEAVLGRGEASDDEIADLVDAVAEAELAYEAARGAAVGAVLRPADVERALRLSNRSLSMLDEERGERITLPNPREEAWGRLLEQHPQQADTLADVRTAWESFERERTTLDDPADLIRLLRGAGVLAFRITPTPGEHPEESRLRRELQENGPRNVNVTDAGWYRLNSPQNWYRNVAELGAMEADPAGFFANRGYVVEPYDGEYYMLAWNTRGTRLTQAEGNWRVDSAAQGSDNIGRPAINFRMNTRGANLLGQLTERHTQENMAILLDDEVYTAPTLQSRITSSGQITGQFTREEIAYIVNVLAAGSLQAKLSPEPISISTVGPNLGLDNLRSGMRAGIWGITAVSVFMVIYYFVAGGVAVITLISSAIVILGAMSLNRAAFTLPGIAGVVLTFGMAVDANVLIYERIREELRKGTDLRAAVRLGYSRALSSIVDGNVTNLIVCVVLAYTGTQEIKGFAITLGVGVVATLFSALIVSRVIFTVLVDVIQIKSLSMLPLKVPVIDRILEPRIDWIKGRYLYMAISGAMVALGLGMVWYQGSEMLDNEFVGGTQVTLDFRDPETGQTTLLTRQEVLDRVVAISADRAEDDPLRPLRTASVLPIDPRGDGVTSDRFQIKTVSTADQQVLAEITRAFQAEIASLPPVSFERMETGPVREAPVYALLGPVLGEEIDRPSVRNQIPDWVGGVAIVMDGINPPVTRESLEQRLATMVEQQDFRELSGRPRQILVLRGGEERVEAAVVLVSDPAVSAVQNPDRFWNEVAALEWELVREAMNRTTTPASVQTFSPAIAATFQAQAIVAVLLSFLLILIYIWVRFGSVRYSMAAIVCLLHDVLVVIGLIALAEIVYDFPATASIAQSIGVLPFKIDLSLVAAILTIIGYSLNDTIIIMDRIRENRGKLPYASRKVVNLSINQTISRTAITSGTTLIATSILFIFGGEGVRAFSYALMLGILVGTYSSIAVAAPLVWTAKKDMSFNRPPEEPAGGSLAPAGPTAT